MKIDTVKDETYFEVLPEVLESFCHEAGITFILIDDFEKAEVFKQKNPQWHVCTLLDLDVVIQGCHFVNRLAYYFINKEIDSQAIERFEKIYRNAA